MPDNCYPPFSVLSEIVRELDLIALPGELDLLSTVSSLFYQRKEKLHQESLVRMDAQIEAKYVSIREERRQNELEEVEEDEGEETSDEEGDSEGTDDERWDEDDHEYVDPSKEEIEALIEYQIAKEARRSGLKRARGETQEGYRKRMRHLEKRIKKLQLFGRKLERVHGEPPLYVEGFPVNLTDALYHVLPHLPVVRTEKFDCLQCKVKGGRCSRSQNYSPVCERCRRHGDPCLVKDMTCPVALRWWFAMGQPTSNIEEVEIEWLERLMNKTRGEAIQALPLWHEADDSSRKGRGEKNTPRWQDFFTGRSEVNIKRVK
ncbi:hypothetical protein FBEOM_11978 [Fusarium beomiforme]|uniref:Uncharacterized protein n=1 Tax=Fusarium beomiforme TaxID=44412 RepID=A0A9P5A8G8_9HYPO|nr:hypothetical protein FBEOM_11978 [Fusarium beomiforme]